MGSVATKKNISEYFDTCEDGYIDYWDLNKSMLMSLGFWNKGTKNLREALSNQNQEMAELAQIKKTDKVLDAGCGVGGSSVFLAKNHGCQMTAITIVNNQVNKVLKNAENHNVSNLIDCQEIDYCNTSFPDESFDVVWGIESICYAKSKKSFIEEAYRILKPGGRIIISEIIAEKTRNNMTPKEIDSLYTNGYNKCMVESLNTEKEYYEDLTITGFKNIRIDDYTKKVYPSIKRLYYGYYVASSLNFFRKLKGNKFTDIQLGNTKMCYNLYKSLNNKLWKYGVIYAEK